MDRSTEFTFGIPWVMSFFHQDWTLDVSTEVEAVAGQFVEELEPAAVLLVRRDARLLIEGLSPGQIAVLWDGCAEDGGHFIPSDRVGDGAAWMHQIIGACDDWLCRRADSPQLVGADEYEGRELAAEALALVEEFDIFLDREVADALTECVRRCTPHLAFRLLLRALPAKSASLSPDCLYVSREQYARLSALGPAFHCGEFVVSEIEYLVDT